MRKLLVFFIIFVMFITSCSPGLHLNGMFMRKFNMSQNKYSPKKPYIKK